MKTLTLLSLFEQSEADLREQLAEIQLPRDEEKFNRILSDLFVDHIKVSEYKQELTASEMAMFQSAIHVVETSLLLNGNVYNFVSNQEETKERSSDDNSKSQIAVSLVTGASILSAGALPYYWGTALLAVVATAINFYLSKSKVHPKEKVISQSIVINSESVIKIVREVCHSIDTLMDVYITNQENLRNRIESKDKPSLSNMYGYLLNRLAILYRDKANNMPERINDDIENIFMTLEDYGYQFINYSENTSSFYKTEEVAEIQEPKLAEVAILENGNLIVKGKYYKPLNK